MICLFVVLGGSSVAQPGVQAAATLITGGHIKDSTVTGRDVRNSSLTGGDVRNGTLMAGDFNPGQLPAGPSGVVFSSQTVALGNSPTATTQFLTPGAQVSVAAGQKVHVVANKAFGTLASPSNGLDLYPCYQSTLFGSPIVTLGSGILNNAMPANSRITMGISHVITGLNSGTYNVGMCGDDDGNGSWLNNDQGYVSAVVLSN